MVTGVPIPVSAVLFDLSVFELDVHAAIIRGKHPEYVSSISVAQMHYSSVVCEFVTLEHNEPSKIASPAAGGRVWEPHCCLSYGHTSWGH